MIVQKNKQNLSLAGETTAFTLELDNSNAIIYNFKLLYIKIRQ
jgi:hypothetical protein